MHKYPIVISLVILAKRFIKTFILYFKYQITPQSTNQTPTIIISCTYEMKIIIKTYRRLIIYIYYPRRFLNY